MAQRSTTKQNTQAQATSQSSWGAVLQRLNNIMGQYGNLPMDSIYNAFGRASAYLANNPIIGNQRVKAIPSLPCDYTKSDLGTFLLSPQNSERPLRQIAEALNFTSYPFYKRKKSYSDMLQFHSFILPQDVEKDEIRTSGFKREYRLVNKLVKNIKAKEEGRQIASEALTSGKVFYVPRYKVDKSHNKIEYFFLQRLPQDWVIIEGFNNISKFTCSFNLCYFLQLGTDYTQFGDLFTPYMDFFDTWQKDKKPIKGKFVYASRNNAREESEVKVFAQNGKWMFYVSLPIDRVWAFSVDNSTAIVASPFSGLMQTDAQQADYEAAQLSLILNPLIKIFTGEIPYNDRDNATQEDSYKLSVGGLEYFIGVFNALMRANQTAGVGMYGAPFQNIKSHDFAESANANAVSNSFLQYSGNKAGLNALVPITENPHQGVAEYSAKLESQFAQNIYQTFDRMVNYILDSLNLNFDFRVHFWGDIYSDELVRSHALKLIDKGDLWGWQLLCSLDDISIYEHVNINNIISDSGLMETFQIPQSTYTQSGKTPPKSTTGGAPEKTEAQVIESKIEKQTESVE